MTTLKITTIGNSVGVILPKEVLALLNADKGDTLYVTRTPDGIALRAYDEEFVRHMEVAEKIMREDRDVLRRLAE
jgi:putative addiction module antidote